MSPARPALAESLDLAPHPEGGWYRETWRTPSVVAVDRDDGRVERAAATSIYYLLHAGERSRFHRIASDELWVWQGGGTMDVYVLAESADPYVLRVGPPGVGGVLGQAVVPAGAWFAATPADGSDHVLVACVVAPGFDFADFALAERDALLAERPDAADWITRFT